MELLDKYGYSLVFAVALIEQLGFPVPVAPLLLLAGAIAVSGRLSFLTPHNTGRDCCADWRHRLVLSWPQKRTQCSEDALSSFFESRNLCQKN